MHLCSLSLLAFFSLGCSTACVTTPATPVPPPPVPEAEVPVVPPVPVEEPTPEVEEPAPAPAEEAAPVEEARPPAWQVVGIREQLVGTRTWEVVTLNAEMLDPAGEKTLSAEGTVWRYVPSGLVDPAPVLLGLPGWKFEGRTWEDHANIGDLADELKVGVVLADMHVSIYASGFYPETLADYRWAGPESTMPGLTWVGEILLPWIESEGQTLLGTFGLSTGGRGAVLVAQSYEGVPRACSMSGTFDLFGLPAGGEYRIHEVVYGSRELHPERWSIDDSMSCLSHEEMVDFRDALDEVPVLLVHGTADPYVPPAQSQKFADALAARDSPVSLVMVPNGGHDWALWSAWLGPCLRFLAHGEEPEGAVELVRPSEEASPTPESEL